MDLVSYSLNDKEMESISGSKVMIYGELAKCNSLDDIFQYKGKMSSSVIICYLTKKNYGHWCCLYKNKHGIGFFDSYGIKPDDELDWNIPEYFRKESDQDYPHLTWLLYHSGLPINYNQFRFQSKDKGIATCGRWVLVRLALKFLSDVEYKKVINELCTITKKTPDMLVVMLTNPALQLLH